MNPLVTIPSPTYSDDLLAPAEGVREALHWNGIRGVVVLHGARHLLLLLTTWMRGPTT